jgi:molybdate transport system ATP-binding protein
MSQMDRLQISLTLARTQFSLNVNVALPGAGVTVLFGPSGSGKTTVLRCIAGLESAEGFVGVGSEVWLDTSSGVNKPTWQRELGYVFQEASLLDHLNVTQNLHFGIKRLPSSRRQTARLALEQAIELLGIGHLLGRPTQGLSGGERQRIAIARALALQPKILLLDEPLASLDGPRRQEILPWLERLHRYAQMPILYVTHSVDELVRLAHYVLLLDNGTVRAQGPLRQVITQHPFVDSLHGQAGSIVCGVVSSRDDKFGLSAVSIGDCADHNRFWVAQLDARVGEQVRLFVHANDVGLALDKPTRTSIQNVLLGTVLDIVEDASPSHVLVKLDVSRQTLIARITKRAAHALDLGPGLATWCQVKSVSLAGEMQASMGSTAA